MKVKIWLASGLLLATTLTGCDRVVTWLRARQAESQAARLMNYTARVEETGLLGDGVPVLADVVFRAPDLFVKTVVQPELLAGWRLHHEGPNLELTDPRSRTVLAFRDLITFTADEQAKARAEQALRRREVFDQRPGQRLHDRWSGHIQYEILFTPRDSRHLMTSGRYRGLARYPLAVESELSFRGGQRHMARMVSLELNGEDPRPPVFSGAEDGYARRELGFRTVTGDGGGDWPSAVLGGMRLARVAGQAAGDSAALYARDGFFLIDARLARPPPGWDRGPGVRLNVGRFAGRGWPGPVLNLLFTADGSRARVLIGNVTLPLMVQVASGPIGNPARSDSVE